MEASLLGSIFFVVAFALLFMGVFQYKKSDEALNGVSWLILSFVGILCYGATTMGLLNMLYVPINIITTGIVYLITGVLLQFLIKKQNVKQVYKWEKYDFIYMAILTLIIFIIGGSYFSAEIRLMYYNSDAAVHFKNAMAVVRTEYMQSMYFAPLHTALIIETAMPFIKEVNLYKIYILTDVAMLLLELSFYMVVIREYVKTRAMKVIALILVVVYMMGYPLNSFLFSFYYWGMGVMVMAFALYMLRMYICKKIDRNIAVLGMMLGCAALPITYTAFGPIVYIAMFITLAFVQAREGKLVTWKNVFLALKVFLLPTCIAIYYCVFTILVAANVTVGGLLSIDGGVYRDLYSNFMWVLPFGVYMIIKGIRKKEINENVITLLCFGVVTVGMLLLIYKGLFAAYYYHKLYYPLWYLFFVLTAEAIESLWDKAKDLLISVFVVFACIACLFWSGFEARIVYSKTGLANADKSSSIFDIWGYNRMLWQNRYLKYSDQYFAICDYVIEELKDEEKPVPLLATQENYAACFWYEGITGEACTDYYGWFNSFDVIKQRIEDGEINYFVVYKDAPIYAMHLDYFEEFEYVYENELGFVAKVK